MAKKKWYKVYGTHNGVEYLLGTINSLGNATVFSYAMMKIYTQVWIDKG